MSPPAAPGSQPTAAAAGQTGATARIGHLAEPDPSPASQRHYDADVEEMGFVMNVSRLWAYQPHTLSGLFDLIGEATEAGGLTFRERAVLVTACASARGDSYCSLAWGARLASRSDPGVAAGVLKGDDSGLTEPERVLAAWARKVVADPGSTAAGDVEELRRAGLRRHEGLRSHGVRRAAAGVLDGERRTRR